MHYYGASNLQLGEKCFTAAWWHYFVEFNMLQGMQGFSSYVVLRDSGC